MAVVRKKQDDKNLKVLREIVSINGNKQCFDCGQRGPTYVNMTIGSFVCTRCSGILRGLTPPHRVKSISMATFTSDEINFVRSHGNDDCGKTWMGLWDPKRITTQDHRELLVDKYERKRYYLEPASPLKSITTTSQQIAASNNTNNSTDALKAITLTPPSSLRLYKNNSTHHNQHLQQPPQQQQNNQKYNLNATNNFQIQFSPEDSNSSIFNQTNQKTRLNNSMNSNINNNSNNSNGFNRNGMNMEITNNLKNNSIIGIQQQTNNNKFTPDSDFVADFSTANIFNSNTINQNNNSNFRLDNNINNINNSKVIGNGLSTESLQHNGVTKNENFADFEHNTIYNAAGLPMSLSSTSNSLNSSGTFTSNSSLNSTPSADRYAALKDLDEQIRETKEKAKTEQPTFNTTVVANPFKTSSNPFQQIQQQQQQVQQQQVQQQQQQQQIPPNWTQVDQMYTVNTNGLFHQSHGPAMLNGAQQHNFIANGFPQQTVEGGQYHNTGVHGSAMALSRNVSNPFQKSITSNNPFL